MATAKATKATKATRTENQTQTQTQKQRKAAEREELPAIRGEGIRQMIPGGPALRCFFVQSRSTPGFEYPVYLMADGRLFCACPSSHYRGTCAHRRAVTQALAEEAAAVVRTQAQAEAESECGWRLTAKGRRALEQWRREQAEAERERERAQKRLDELLERAARERDSRETGAIARTSQTPSRRVSSAPRGATGHASHSAAPSPSSAGAHAGAHPGDTALLRHSNQPFSFWK